MTPDELRTLIQRANWFARLGQYTSADGTVALRNLEAWRTEDAVVEDGSGRIADEMEWLPTTADQPDPVHGDRLKNQLQSEGRGQLVRDTTREVQSLVLKSLRGMQPRPLLKVGAHDFTNAARGAASYAARQAAIEILTSSDDFWCGAMRLYAQGHWPCGLTPKKELVVL